jgi:hypothetical protein
MRLSDYRDILAILLTMSSVSNHWDLKCYGNQFESLLFMLHKEHFIRMWNSSLDTLDIGFSHSSLGKKFLRFSSLLELLAALFKINWHFLSLKIFSLPIVSWIIWVFREWEKVVSRILLLSLLTVSIIAPNSSWYLVVPGLVLVIYSMHYYSLMIVKSQLLMSSYYLFIYYAANRETFGRLDFCWAFW